ncbi:unnamed protein product [Acanthosepion pharaonis]|uniref:Uncharacterized protein n=1 Tax=Acanthosepion pharaonis TaxID=158019 RepID=A0A812DAL5_ACAPH|nr:unnamed protein product [Sepia pharaonis]
MRLRRWYRHRMDLTDFRRYRVDAARPLNVTRHHSRGIEQRTVLLADHRAVIAQRASVRRLYNALCGPVRISPAHAVERLTPTASRSGSVNAATSGTAGPRRNSTCAMRSRCEEMHRWLEAEIAGRKCGGPAHREQRRLMRSPTTPAWPCS